MKRGRRRDDSQLEICQDLLTDPYSPNPTETGFAEIISDEFPVIRWGSDSSPSSRS